jgi:hypothetical protein
MVAGVTNPNSENHIGEAMASTERKNDDAEV